MSATSSVKALEAHASRTHAEIKKLDALQRRLREEEVELQDAIAKAEAEEGGAGPSPMQGPPSSSSHGLGSIQDEELAS